MKDEQLAQLFDYTKFHIGMYTTLIAGIIGIFANDTLKHTYGALVPYIKYSICFLLLAGAAGGLVASSIPFYSSFEEFRRARLGPWRWKLVPSIVCTHVEHTAFWIGIGWAVFGLFNVLPHDTSENMNHLVGYLNVIGLIAGFVGGLVTFFYGLPNIDVLNSGGYVQMQETDSIRRYKSISKVGVGLIAAGFLMQIPSAICSVN